MWIVAIARGVVVVAAAPCLRASETSAIGSRGMKTKLCVLAVAALVIWGMKRHYADARADDLWWILSPTARLVGVMTGTAFAAAPGEGYVLARASVRDREIMRGDQLHDRRVRHAGVRARSPCRIRHLRRRGSWA